MAITKEFEEISKEISKLNNKFGKELVEKKTQLDWLNSELDSKIKILEGIKEQDNNLNGNIQKKTSKLNTIDKQIFDREQEFKLLNDLKSEISSKTLEKNNLLNDIADINRKIQEIKREEATTIKENEQTSTKVNNLLKTKNNLMIDITSFTKEIDMKKNNLTESENKLSIVNGEIGDAKRILEETNSKINDKTIGLSSINDKLAITKNEKEKEDSNLNELGILLDNRKAELDKIKEEGEIEKNKISHERDRLLSVRKEILQTIINNRKIMDSDKIAEFIKSVREEDNDSGSRERTDTE